MFAKLAIEGGGICDDHNRCYTCVASMYDIENASMDRHSYASTSISFAKGSRPMFRLLANHSQASLMP